MLPTRLWMGALMALVGAGVLIFDHWLSPWYPFLLIVGVSLAPLAGRELIRLCPSDTRPPRTLCLSLLALLVVSNWAGDWVVTVITFVAAVIVLFLHEMATYQRPGNATIRMAFGTWVLAYVGLLGSCLIQLRWVEPDVVTGVVPWSLPFALAFFSPKIGDIGAYFSGRFFGRTQFSPKLSPKKTWEGTLGGILISTAATVGFFCLAHGGLGREWWSPLGLGVVLAVAGVLGDLAASLVKRDLGVKDAGGIVPGFGGVIDVIDSVLFAAPVVYVWWIFVGVGSN